MRIFDKILKFALGIIGFLVAVSALICLWGLVVFACSKSVYCLYIDGNYISFFLFLSPLILIYALVIRTIIDLFKKEPDIFIAEGIQNLFKGMVKEPYKNLKCEIKD